VNAPAAPDHFQRRLKLAGAVLLAVFFSLYGIRCVKKGWYDPPTKDGSDFTAYYAAGELAGKGQDITARENSSAPGRQYIYPPTFAVFPMALLGFLPHNTALIVFYVLNLALLLGSLWLLKRLLYPPTAPPVKSFWTLPEFGLLAAVLACGRLFDSNMQLSNANIFVLFPIVLGLYLLQRERGFWGGICIALATCYKATPGLYGLYFLWSRRVWAMAGGALGLLIFLALLPIAVIGYANTHKAMHEWIVLSTQKLAAQDVDEQPADAAADTKGKPNEDSEANPRAVGISLRGTFLKLFADTTALNRKEAGGEKQVNVTHLETATVVTIASVFSLLLLLTTVVLTFPKAAGSTAYALTLSWGLIALTMLLVSPLTRKAHAVVLVIPVTALIALLQQGRLAGDANKFARRLAWLSLIVLALAGTGTSPDLIGERASQVAHAMGCWTWSMLLLFAAVAVCLRVETRAAAEASANPASPA